MAAPATRAFGQEDMNNAIASAGGVDERHLPDSVLLLQMANQLPRNIPTHSRLEPYADSVIRTCTRGRPLMPHQIDAVKKVLVRLVELRREHNRRGKSHTDQFRQARPIRTMMPASSTA